MWILNVSGASIDKSDDRDDGDDKDDGVQKDEDDRDESQSTDGDNENLPAQVQSDCPPNTSLNYSLPLISNRLIEIRNNLKIIVILYFPIYYRLIGSKLF